MKITVIRLGVNVQRQFRSYWLLSRRRKIYRTKAEEILRAKGIQVVDAKDVIRPAVIEKPFVPPPPPPSDHIVDKKKPLCYIFRNSFVPLEDMEQCQLLTNSLVFNSLPERILDKVKIPTKEDEEAMADIILNSELLDAKQEKLPHVLDVINLPGYKPPRKWGIRIDKKISSLLYHMLVHVERSLPDVEPKRILEDVWSKITLNHSGKLMHMCHEAPLLLCSKTPLKPVVDQDEVQAKIGTPMPDIFPLSPFIHCKSRDDFDLNDGFALPGGALAPHTIFVNFIRYRLIEPTQFYGMTLLHAFSHAASYARERNKDLTGDLQEPVTVNVVHTNGQNFHLGIFQLNTLDCNGSTRNFFWHEPWTVMYKTLGFTNAKPSIEDLNPRPLSLLRAIY